MIAITRCPNRKSGTGLKHLRVDSKAVRPIIAISIKFLEGKTDTAPKIGHHD